MDLEAERRREVLHRLSRLEGQVRAVRRMIEQGQECEQIVLQLSAVHAALEGAVKLAVIGFFRECLTESGAGGEGQAVALDRLASLLLNTRM